MKTFDKHYIINLLAETSIKAYINIEHEVVDACDNIIKQMAKDLSDESIEFEYKQIIADQADYVESMMY